MSTYSIPSHPTWKIHDSSKMKEYINCPRKYFFQYILGWTVDNANKDLIFGESYHQGQAKIGVGRSKKWDKETILLTANLAAKEYYDKYFFPEDYEVNFPKVPSTLEAAFEQYYDLYKDDKEELIGAEIGGSALISSDPIRLIHFRMDQVIRDRHRGVVAREYKTTGMSLSEVWRAQWRTSLQIGIYNYALYAYINATGLDPNEFWGVEVDAISIPRKGTPLAFLRIPERRTKKDVAAFLVRLNYWMERLEHDFELFSETKESDSVMAAFPLSGALACTAYFKVCPYQTFCSTWRNPLQHLDKVPLDFKIEHWNPLDKLDEKNLMEI